MILNFSNLSHFTPSALTLTLTGAAVVSKGLSAVTISGNVLSYSPTSAEKSSLGSGLITAQVKLTASGTFYKSPIVQLDANDLDNEVLTVLTLSEDNSNLISDIALRLGAAESDINALEAKTAIVALSPEPVSGITVNRSEFIRIGDIVFVSASITLASQFANNSNLYTGFPTASHIFDFPCNNPVSNYARQVYLITSGTLRCAQAFPAGTYAFNGWYHTDEE